MESKVFNMDCLEGMKQYPDKHFELAIVDPPYGINMDGNAGKSTKYKKKNWDNQAPDSSFFTELKRVSKNQIIWGANHFAERIPEAGSPCWIVWDKRENVIPERTFADGEIAYTSFGSPLRIFRHYWDGFLQKIPEQRTHPTQKPVQLYKWLLKNYAKEGDKILDTHLGSGSSRIAAFEMGFDFTGFELDKEYYEAQEKRYLQHISQLNLFKAA